MLDHRARHVVIDAVPVPNQPDGAGFTAATDHLGGRPTHRQHATACFVGRHHRRLVHDDTLPLDVDENGRGAQVDANFFESTTASIPDDPGEIVTDVAFALD